MKKKTFHPGGVKLHDCKLSAQSPIVDVGLPRRVAIALNRHQGRPAKAVVSPGDVVNRYQLVAEATAFISANVHSPISGVVKKVGFVEDAFGFQSEMVEIEATDEMRQADEATELTPRTEQEIAILTAEEIRRISRQCGLVGMGGATFPTDVKLTVPEGKKADVLIVNGTECEPYLTCDHALMLAHSADIIKGVRLAMKACGAPKAMIGVEENKPDAIAALTEASVDDESISVVCLKERYPQGGEKQLTNALTGKHVPSGGLPIDAGAVVINVATVYALWRAVAYGEPLVERIVTVTGPSVPHPANYKACIGQNIDTLLSLSGIEEIEQGSKLIFGGPMMGRAIVNTNTSIDKGSSGLLLLPPDMALRVQPEPCIRCARCVDACPMGLEPYLIANLSRLAMFDRAADESIADCIECGCCSYSCPAKRPLLDYIRLGKDTIRNRKKSK